MIEQQIADLAIKFIQEQYSADNLILTFFKGSEVVLNPEFNEYNIHESDCYIVMKDNKNHKGIINITGDQFDGIVLKILLLKTTFNTEEEHG